MTDYELFDTLDMDRDGILTRQELLRAALEFGWGRHQAPIFALLDFMTIRTPLEREAFVTCMAEVSRDLQGVYGRVLLQGPLGAEPPCRKVIIDQKGNAPVIPDRVVHPIAGGTLWDGSAMESVVGLLGEIVSSEHSGDFSGALERSGIPHFAVCSHETALLLIDPQRSFTAGEWMWGLGPSGELEVMPIRLAFDNCARLLKAIYNRVEVMFTRCPFSPQDYGWDEELAGIIDDRQLYFIKPGNNALIPASNGFREWVEGLIDRGIKTLVMGGCTLNSCLRVSAVATRNNFPAEKLNLVVDLSLCGARASNYLNSPQFGGVSAVECAMQEMSDCGVIVAERVAWV